jgi:ankyrin repeat protein
MPASLPPRPNLEWLRKTAKERLWQLRVANRSAKLADAQLAVAREYGFPSWRKLKVHVEQQSAARDLSRDKIVGTFLNRVGTGRIDDVRAMLGAAPVLVNAVGPHPFWGGRPQALHVAIEGKRRDMFDLLLEHGADVNGANSEYDYWSPLMLAIDRKQPDMQEELRRRGAHVGPFEALMLGDDRLVEDLFREGALPAVAPNAGSILALARTPFAIDRLIALGASTDKKDRWGSTPIDAMSRLGPRGTPLVKHMIDRGVSAAPKEYARLGDRETLARLLEGDPSIARLDSVMMGAVDFRHHALAEWLLQHGGNVNARSDAESRHTALHSAAWNGDLTMVKLLVAAGADIDARDDRYDGTPIGWAETSIEISNNPKCTEVVEYLKTLSDRDINP